MAELENNGAPWCEEQDAWLTKAIKKHSIEKCAELMKRTCGSIKSRLIKICCDRIQSEQLSIEEACQLFNVELSDVKRKLNTKIEAYYAVRRGYKPGIYTTWAECKEQITGFTGGSFKKFKTEEEANDFLQNTEVESYQEPEPKSPKSQETYDIEYALIQLPTLSDEQQNVITTLFETSSKKSVFLTGPAGTGKSITLQAIVHHVRLRNMNFGITAMTGTAGYLIGGTTLHSFLGIGIGNCDIHTMVMKLLKRNKKKYDALCELDLMIIDEVSMLDNELFTKVSKYLQIIRKNNKPFGGVQLVLCGDMCQLQCVDNTYCFLCNEWGRLNPHRITLSKIFRQDGDREFIDMLMELRYGHCSEATLKRLQECKTTQFPDGIIPTRLYSRNQDVDIINNNEFIKLVEKLKPEQCRIYKTVYIKSKKDDSIWTTSAVKKWAERNNIVDITLCEGAQVVVTRNIKDLNVFNGTRGVIEKVTDTYVLLKVLNQSQLIKIPMVDILIDDDHSAYVKCLPLKYAWAISIHKSQGMTLDCVEMDLGSSIFTYGQAYTALSRAKNLSSIRIVDVVKSSFRTHPDVLVLYNQ